MMRRECGKDIKLIGGVDKTRLIAGKEEIDKEIERIRPMVEEGGFIPHVDHRCPPDVTLENYNYYLKRKREAFGIPDQPPGKTANQPTTGRSNPTCHSRESGNRALASCTLTEEVRVLSRHTLSGL